MRFNVGSRITSVPHHGDMVWSICLSLYILTHYSIFVFLEKTWKLVTLVGSWSSLPALLALPYGPGGQAGTWGRCSRMVAGNAQQRRNANHLSADLTWLHSPWQRQMNEKMRNEGVKNVLQMGLKAAHQLNSSLLELISFYTSLCVCPFFLAFHVLLNISTKELW